MNDILAYMEEKVRLCKQAQKEWNTLLYSSKLAPNEYVILFTGIEKEVNYYGMKYLDTFLQRVNGEKAVILTHDPIVKRDIQRYSRNVKSIVDCDKEQVKRFIALYELYNFDNRFIVISLDEPFIRKSDGLIGIKNTTIEQLVAIGIYSIIPFRPLKSGSYVI